MVPARTVQEREGEGRGREWRGQGAGLGLGLSKTTRDGEVAHMQRVRETTRRSVLHTVDSVRSDSKLKFYPKKSD